MKKLAAMLLTLCFTLSILGCSEDKKTKKPETKPAAATTTAPARK
ncbi:MAG TPA: hypothetical protein VFG04_15595 [Planctomycetaceae bacterium]|nr:hypothetical protein [Planctomycetaceae bacterium]